MVMGLLGVARSGRPRPRMLVVCRLVGDTSPPSFREIVVESGSDARFGVVVSVILSMLKGV